MRVYEKPVITVDSGMAEGIYAEVEQHRAH